MFRVSKILPAVGQRFPWLASAVSSTATRFPAAFRFAVWSWSRRYIWFKRRSGPWGIPWLFTQMASLVDYRLPIKTELLNGMKVIVPFNDHGGLAIYKDGYYEPDTVRLFRKLLSPGMVVFDIGANIGQYTLVASGRIGATGQVHSFEPDPTTFQWLTRNTDLNAPTNVSLNQAALFSEVGQKTLFRATVRDTGSTSFAIPWTYSGGTCEVSCTTVDEYIRSRNIREVALIKIDVEGSEMAVLQGAGALLDKKTRPLLIVEFEEERQEKFGTSCAKLAEFLISKEYDLYRCGDTPLELYEPGPHNPYSLNILAIPKDRVTAVLKTLEEPEQDMPGPSMDARLSPSLIG